MNVHEHFMNNNVYGVQEYFMNLPFMNCSLRIFHEFNIHELLIKCFKMFMKPIFINFWFMNIHALYMNNS